MRTTLTNHEPFALYCNPQLARPDLPIERFPIPQHLTIITIRQFQSPVKRACQACCLVGKSHPPATDRDGRLNFHLGFNDVIGALLGREVCNALPGRFEVAYGTSVPPKWRPSSLVVMISISQICASLFDYPLGSNCTLESPMRSRLEKRSNHWAHVGRGDRTQPVHATRHHQ